MSLAGWDAGPVTVSKTSFQYDGNDDWGTDTGMPNLNNLEVSREEATQRFLNFIRNFVVDKTFIYRDQLRSNYTIGKYILEVNLENLYQFDESLANLIQQFPSQLIPCFEEAVVEAIKLGQIVGTEEDNEFLATLRPQILFESNQQPITIRQLRSEHIGKLVVVPGIVISNSRSQARPTVLQLQCKFCGKRKTVASQIGQPLSLPIQCDSQKLQEEKADNPVTLLNPTASSAPTSKCGPNPYMILGDECEYVDQQLIKLQEAPEETPTGKLPAHLSISAERYLVSRAPAGTRVIAVGIYTVSGSAGFGHSIGDAVRPAYLQLVGLVLNSAGAGRSIFTFTREEEQKFIEFSRLPNVYEMISKSIAPAIYGHEDKKKAIAALLFGGSTKRLPDGMRIRGDINVLLLGDPGVAKSQFLKFVEKVAPVGIYTSGKGSSAAGLTASVIREKQTKEYYLEGGAMVLADGGVVCIDEFDKMHSHDRVAIHEAMEQQTISIAKAGITTILNARTSVLAAANPIFGSFDDMVSPTENIEFQSTILSRFDMIFLIKDIRCIETDTTIAGHVVQVNIDQEIKHVEGLVEISFLKKYIAYCRSHCTPVLTEKAADILRNHYVNIRSSVHQQNKTGKQSAIPITVRQLEAIVRIAESIAKMALSPFATEDHVNEAIRLFKSSTLDAALSGTSSENLSPDLLAEVNAAETYLKRRLAIGARCPVGKLVKEVEIKQKLSRVAIQKAITIMAQRKEISFQSQRKWIVRTR